MNATVCSDMTWSALAFRDTVWPAISDKCGGGRIDHVEGRDRVALDIYAGIDAWQVLYGERAMRGIASRVQYDSGKFGYPYNTFSIRVSRPGCDTEYLKRLGAIKSDRGLVWPHLTVQAYLDAEKKELLSVGVVLTKQLFLYVERMGLDAFRKIENADGSSCFIAVPWADLKIAGVRVEHAKVPHE